MRISDWSSDVCSSDLDEGVEVTRHVDLRITLRKRAVGEARSRRTEVDLRGAVEHVLQHFGRERHRQALIGEVPRAEVIAVVGAVARLGLREELERRATLGLSSAAHREGTASFSTCRRWWSREPQKNK